jgi:hypothetical protein
MKKTILICTLSFLLTSCAIWKPAAKITKEAVAIALCEQWVAETGYNTGIDRAKWCRIFKNLEPFFDLLTGMEQTTGTTYESVGLEKAGVMK